MRPISSPAAARALLAALALAALAGCGTSPRLDRQLGDAVRLSTAQQTLHPNAAYAIRPVAGLDGRAAAAAYDNYQRSYATPPQDAGSSSLGIGNAR